MKKITLITVLAFILLSSCKKDKYDAGSSNTLSMSGRWWVELSEDLDGNGVSDHDPLNELWISYHDYEQFALTTSNTASNSPDSLLIDDVLSPPSAWGIIGALRIKAGINQSTMTVNPATYNNIDQAGETVRVVEGKILKGAARTKSGAVADSIYLLLEYSEYPGTNWIYSGHRDSGQPEDQY